MKKFLKSLLYSVLLAVAIFTIGLIVALFLPEGSKPSLVTNVVSYGVTLVITLFLLYWAFIVSFKVLKILFPNIVPYVLNVSRKHLFILLLVCAVAFLIQDYIPRFQIPEYLINTFLILASIGYAIYVFSADPKKVCSHCQSTKLTYREGKETEHVWIYANKDGSPDKRRKNNYQVANFVSEWSCKKCERYTKFKHFPSRKPSKANRIEIVL